jgi:Zn-dependent peptidase ImmA (M78 family)
MKVLVNIKPELLIWAYERAGYGRQEAVRLFPMLEAWLEGKKHPTARQAEQYAAKFYVPLGFLMLSTPPEEAPIIPMFRKGNSKSPGSLNVYDTINQIAMRQSWMSDYLQEIGADPVPFVAAFQNRNEDEMVACIRELLDVPESWAEQFHRSEDLVRILAAKIEDKSVAVSFNGVVGNNTHRQISVEDCRGFALVDDFAPFIFVNNSDAKPAQYFTLIHEFVHILIGYGASYGLNSVNHLTEENERFCDEVAARFLAPKSAFEKYWEGLEKIEIMARKLKASYVVIARRALALHLITKEEFKAFWDELEKRREEWTKEKKRSGGSFYPTAHVRMGAVFSTHISNAVRGGYLLYNDAYRLTGLSGNTFSKTFQVR